jgi:hypothetical protein
MASTSIIDLINSTRNVEENLKKEGFFGNSKLVTFKSILDQTANGRKFLFRDESDLLELGVYLREEILLNEKKKLVDLLDDPSSLEKLNQIENKLNENRQNALHLKSFSVKSFIDLIQSFIMIYQKPELTI